MTGFVNGGATGLALYATATPAAARNVLGLGNAWRVYDLATYPGITIYPHGTLPGGAVSSDTALANLAAEINAANVPVVITCSQIGQIVVCDTPSPYSITMNFIGVPAIKWELPLHWPEQNADGLLFYSRASFADGQTVAFAAFNSCGVIDLGDMTFEQANKYTVSTAFGRGISWITSAGKNAEVRHGTIVANGGRYAIDAVTNSAFGHTGTDRTAIYSGQVLHCRDVAYPLANRGNFASVALDYLYAFNSARPYFTTRHDRFHIGEMYRAGAGNGQALVLVATDTSDPNYAFGETVGPVVIDYLHNSVPTGACLDFEIRGSNPGTFGGLTVRDFDAVYPVGSDLTAQLFTSNRTVSASTPQTTQNIADVVGPIRLSGRFNTPPVNLRAAEFFRPNRGTWLGATIADMQLDCAIYGTSSARVEVNTDVLSRPPALRMRGVGAYRQATDDALPTPKILSSRWAVDGRQWEEARAVLGSDQTVTSTSLTKIVYGTELYDFGRCYDTTAGQWVAPRDCTVALTAVVRATGLTAGNEFTAQFVRVRSGVGNVIIGLPLVMIVNASGLARGTVVATWELLAGDAVELQTMASTQPYTVTTLADNRAFLHVRVINEA